MVTDTLEVLRVKTPLPVGKLGSVFWRMASYSKKIPYHANHRQLDNDPWETHYSLPQNRGFAIIIELNEPLRHSRGCEEVQFYADYRQHEVIESYDLDGEQVPIRKICIPPALIRSLKDLLLFWQGEGLDIHYSLVPGEGNPFAITADFNDCRSLPADPDVILQTIASTLTKALAHE